MTTFLLASYSWRMDGKPYDPSGNAGRVAIQPGVGTLIFANPLERDEGFYQCNATNIMGTAISIKSYMRVACKYSVANLVRNEWPDVDGGQMH